MATGCLKSDEPVRFQGNLLESVYQTNLGFTSEGRNRETGEITRVIQLRTEGIRTYLYSCTPNSEIEKIEARIYRIPNQNATFVMSLEEGKFFLNQSSSAGHEVFVLRPFNDRIGFQNIDDETSEIAEAYFSRVRPVSSTSSDVYSATAMKDFLTNHLDEFLAEEGLLVLQHRPGNLTSCDFLN